VIVTERYSMPTMDRYGSGGSNESTCNTFVWVLGIDLRFVFLGVVRAVPKTGS
jgi:hypothetical protein